MPFLVGDKDEFNSNFLFDFIPAETWLRISAGFSGSSILIDNSCFFCLLVR